MVYKSSKARIYSTDVDTDIFDIVSEVFLEDTLALFLSIIKITPYKRL